ncbi:MAG TPA: D-2-hydroxyacid dehydrogenase [Polyangiaceae bacterium]|jgi:glycerate dehydrogenase
MTRIVIFDGYTINPGDNPWTPLAELGELTVFDRSTPEEAVERAFDAEIALTNKVLLDANVIARAPKLCGIGVLATGVNAVDLKAASARGVPVCNVPSYSNVSVAQHAIALLLELCHRVGSHDASVHAGDWQKSPDFSYRLSSITELDGKLLGVVGYGAIGRRVAAAARGLGMQVCAAELGHARAGDEAVERLPLDELFRQCDVITLHCPLTPETKHLVSTARLALMKPSAFLINTARGALIDEPALRHALDSAALAGAALDVLSSEPPRDDNPLLSAKNCVITPHIAWTSLPARKRLLEITVDNVRALISGTPIHVANPDYALATR